MYQYSEINVGSVANLGNSVQINQQVCQLRLGHPVVTYEMNAVCVRVRERERERVCVTVCVTVCVISKNPLYCKTTICTPS